MKIILYSIDSNLPILFLDECNCLERGSKTIINANLPIGEECFNQNDVLKVLTERFTGKRFIFKFEYGLFVEKEIDLLIDNVDAYENVFGKSRFKFTCTTQ